jgi:hypothetical protein
MKAELEIMNINLKSSVTFKNLTKILIDNFLIINLPTQLSATFQHFAV